MSHLALTLTPAANIEGLSKALISVGHDVYAIYHSERDGGLVTMARQAAIIDRLPVERDTTTPVADGDTLTLIVAGHVVGSRDFHASRNRYGRATLIPATR